jgi:hypothetical protein
MNEHPRWSGASVVAAIVGGFAFALLVLVAGFAGNRIVEIDRPGWAALVALLAMCGTTALVGAGSVWRQYRTFLTNVDPQSVAGLRQRYEAQGGVAGVCMILFFALPLVLVRQTYWSWAPWVALLSVLVCAAGAVWAWRVSLRLQDQYYRALPPVQLWQEIQRHRPKTFKHARRFMIFALVFGLAQLTFQFVGLWMDWTGDTLPPRTVHTWMSWLQPFYFLSFSSALWAQARLVERWRQTFHIARG